MDTMALVGRLLISLAAVLGLIWLVARKFRGGNGRKARSNKLIDVLGRQSLSRSSSVAVVRVGEKALIVGVTDASVRVLGDIELDAVEAQLDETATVSKRPALRGPLRIATGSGAAGAGIADPGMMGTAAAEPDIARTSAAHASAAHPTTSPAHTSAPRVTTTPSSPAALTGTLSEADIAAIRAARHSARRPDAAIGRPRSAMDDNAARSSGAQVQQRVTAGPEGAGVLAGSALSPTTWRQTMNALREMTVRKG